MFTRFEARTRKRSSIPIQSNTTSIQFINVVDKGQKVVKTNEKRPQVTLNDDGTKSALYPAIHRSAIGRRTLKYTAQKVGDIDRFYYSDERDFRDDLKKLNSTRKNKQKEDGDVKNKREFVCVGYANTRLKFCSVCFDVSKENEVEQYYVNKQDISQRRTVLCRGCIGTLLQRMNKKENENENVFL